MQSNRVRPQSAVLTAVKDLVVGIPTGAVEALRRNENGNARAVAGFCATGLLAASIFVPLYAATQKDGKKDQQYTAYASQVPPGAFESSQYPGAAAIAAQTSLVGRVEPVSAANNVLDKVYALEEFDNLVIATPREDYTAMMRREQVIEELIRRAEAGNLKASGVKISDGAEEMVDYAIKTQTEYLDLPRGESADAETVLLNALTVHTIRMEKAVTQAAAMVAAAPVIDQAVATRVLAEKAAEAQADAKNLAKFADSVDEYKNGQIPAKDLCKIEGYIKHRLRCDAAAQLDRMNAAFKAQFGKDLQITDTYRSLEEQIELKKEKPRLAGKPGTSNHGWGRAIDVTANIHWDHETPEHLWMKENAPKFGWYNPKWAQAGGKKEEAWHWEFFGEYRSLSDTEKALIGDMFDDVKADDAESPSPTPSESETAAAKA